MSPNPNTIIINESNSENTEELKRYLIDLYERMSAFNGKYNNNKLDMISYDLNEYNLIENECDRIYNENNILLKRLNPINVIDVYYIANTYVNNKYVVCVFNCDDCDNKHQYIAKMISVKYGALILDMNPMNIFVIEFDAVFEPHHILVESIYTYASAPFASHRKHINEYIINAIDCGGYNCKFNYRMDPKYPIETFINNEYILPAFGCVECVIIIIKNELYGSPAQNPTVEAGAIICDAPTTPNPSFMAPMLCINNTKSILSVTNNNMLSRGVLDLETNIFPFFIESSLYELYIHLKLALSINSFVTLRVLGRGAFSFVNAVIKKNNRIFDIIFSKENNEIFDGNNDINDKHFQIKNTIINWNIRWYFNMLKCHH